MQVDLGFSRELYELLARETRNEIEGRGEMQMREGQDGTQWEHVHKCPQCDYVIKSDEMSHSATAIGIIPTFRTSQTAFPGNFLAAF